MSANLGSIPIPDHGGSYKSRGSRTCSKFSFFKGTSLKPVPPIGQFKDVRSLDVRESDKIDEKQLATWIKQAASIPGWDGGSPRYGGSPL